AELAKRRGVEHFVYTSVGSAHRKTGIPHFDNKWRVEETVRRLGFPSYVVIRPVFFMENWISGWFKPGIDQGKLMIGLKPDTVVQMIAVRDIGQYGRLAFEKHVELQGRAIDIAGDAHTMPETARILSQAAGRTITFQPVPIAEVRKASMDYALMLEWFDRVGYDVDIPAVAKEYRVRPTTLKEWAGKISWP
ncbi:MAG: NmrA/HSCARG family protein, partial [Gemmatimonadetes bacterium]